MTAAAAGLLLRQTFAHWLKDCAPRMGAARVSAGVVVVVLVWIYDAAQAVNWVPSSPGFMPAPTARTGPVG